MSKRTKIRAAFYKDTLYTWKETLSSDSKVYKRYITWLENRIINKENKNITDTKKLVANQKVSKMRSKKEVLEDELSDIFLKQIDENDGLLRRWIYNAMDIHAAEHHKHFSEQAATKDSNIEEQMTVCPNCYDNKMITHKEYKKETCTKCGFQWQADC